MKGTSNTDNEALLRGNEINGMRFAFLDAICDSNQRRLYRTPVAAHVLGVEGCTHD